MKKKVIIGIIAGDVIAVAAVICFIVFRNNYRDVSVFELHNSVELERKGKETKIFEGMKLRGGDEVSVGEESYSRLMLDEDKLVYLGEGTEAQLKELSGSAGDTVTKILITKGEMITEIREKLSSESVYEIETPNSILAIRGTVVITRVEKVDGEYRISSYCQEGSADITVYVVEDGEVVASECTLEAGEGLTVTTEEVPEDFSEAVRTEQADSLGELVEFLDGVDNVTAKSTGMEQYDLGGQNPEEFEGAGGESKIVYLTDGDVNADGAGDSTGDGEQTGDATGAGENAGEQTGDATGAGENAGEQAGNIAGESDETEGVITRTEEFYDEDGWRIVREYSGEELVCESGYDETEDGDGRYYIEHYEDGLAVRLDSYYADGSMYEYGLYYYQDGKLIRYSWYSPEGVQKGEYVFDSEERVSEGWWINEKGEKEIIVYEYTDEDEIVRHYREDGTQFYEKCFVMDDSSNYILRYIWGLYDDGSKFEDVFENGEIIYTRYYDAVGTLYGCTEYLTDGREKYTRYLPDGAVDAIVIRSNPDDMERMTRHEFYDAAGTLEYYVIDSYYDDGHQKEYRQYFPDGTLKSEYYYNEDGSIISGWGINGDGTTYTEERDESGNLVSRDYLATGELYGESVSGEEGTISSWYIPWGEDGLGDTKHVCVYENGKAVREDIYDSNGELLNTYSLDNR